MSKFGVRFSTHFGIDPKWMNSNNVFDPNLDLDSPLFVDPFLLDRSTHSEFNDCGFRAFEERFTAIHRLLGASKAEGDKAWTSALKLFNFSEAKGMSGTCLGYSKNSTSGRGFGKVLAEKSLRWAKEVIDLGVKDPELFSSLSLFESGIGADRVSDMVVSIVAPCICEFNERMIAKAANDLGIVIPTEIFRLRDTKYRLARNPYTNTVTPVLLLADDILRHHELLDEPGAIDRAIACNEAMRDRASYHIGEIFKLRQKNEIADAKAKALESAEAFQAFLDILKGINETGYDVKNDPLGLVNWSDGVREIVKTNVPSLTVDKALDEIEQINKVVLLIISYFKDVIEKNRLNRLFYDEAKHPRHEKYAQLLFFGVAKWVCDTNNIDISPESDGGAGPVDFKFSTGTKKILVELKLSTNPKVVPGYQKQMDAYEAAEDSQIGHYVVLDVGKMGKKAEQLLEFKNEHPSYAKIRDIHFIDATLKDSASRL
ncbi:hypothetical protein [Maricaulis sp.]|uniref:hypothetical protein n=1 Tax=Maricaulis sp. TaxID=1486257 RepID=UPI003A95C139